MSAGPVAGPGPATFPARGWRRSADPGGLAAPRPDPDPSGTGTAGCAAGCAGEKTAAWSSSASGGPQRPGHGQGDALPVLGLPGELAFAGPGQPVELRPS